MVESCYVKEAAVSEIIADYAFCNRIALTITVSAPVIQPIPVIAAQRVGGKKQQQSHSHKGDWCLEIPYVCYDLFLGNEPDQATPSAHYLFP
jgi:hypothetical protein